MKFDIRFQHGSSHGVATALHLTDDAGKAEEGPFAFVNLHLVSETEADATIILLREEHAKPEVMNDLLLKLNNLLHGRAKRALRHAELFVQGSPPAGPDRPIAGFHVLANVSTPSSHRLWLRESDGAEKSDGPVTCMVDVLLTNPFMATLIVVPFDSRLNSEQALRALIQWIIDAVPFLSERKNVMQEMAIKAHPSRYLGGADIRPKDGPESALPEKWPGVS